MSFRNADRMSLPLMGTLARLIRNGAPDGKRRLHPTSSRAGSRRISALALIAALALLPASAGAIPTHRPDGSGVFLSSLLVRTATPGGGELGPSLSAPDPAVQAMQEALAALKAYKGPVDGIMTGQLRDAIKAYQTANGLFADGRISEDLLTRIKTAAGVGQLLSQLKQVREASIRKARQALQSNPATRHLLDRPKTETADPTRDASACFRAPTAECLLDEASESAKAIFQDDMRDWALGELLAAESKAGRTDAAMATVQRIADPRLIMAALRDMAESLATGNNTTEALQAARIIPDPARQAEALAAIATIETKRGLSKETGDVIGALEALIPDVDDAVQKVALGGRAAVLYARAGKMDEAHRTLAKAEKLAESMEGPAQAVALRHVASTYADIGEPEEAYRRLQGIGTEAERIPVLVSAANARIEAGEFANAFSLAAEIPAARYRASALARIGEALAQKSDAAQARKALDQALAALGDSRTPAFARDYVESQMALVFASLAGSEGSSAIGDALAAAGRIKDAQLRAKTIWTIWFKSGALKEGEEGAALRKKAETAAGDIKSPLSRAWMYAELANEQANADDKAGARTAFDAGLAVAREIGSPWARTRALARLASTLIELERPKTPSGGAP